MNDHFIKNIEIKNFKCFEDFTAEGFGRVNLIGGKNNVGKTAFMEACYVNVQAQNLKCFIGSLQNIKYMRENLNILDNRGIYNGQTFVEQSNHIFISSNINQIHFRINENDGIKKYYFEFNQQIIDVNAKEFSFDFDFLPNIKFIDNFGLFNSEIKEGYLAVQKKDQEQFLNDILNQFDARIEKFIGGDTPQCRVNGAWLDLTELGDGARHLVSIVVSLFKCENGTLFIDELENGIHYSHLDKLWEIILTVSKEQNVQVFATTHSKECIESYARVAKKLADEEVTYSLLTRLKSGKLHHSLYDYALLENAIIEQAHEVR